MNVDNIIESNFESMFWDVINQQFGFLRKTNQEYIKIFNRLMEITSTGNLCTVLEEDKITELSREDVVLLKEYIQLTEDKYVIEMKTLFITILLIYRKIDFKLEKYKSDISK